MDPRALYGVPAAKVSFARKSLLSPNAIPHVVERPSRDAYFTSMIELDSISIELRHICLVYRDLEVNMITGTLCGRLGSIVYWACRAGRV